MNLKNWKRKFIDDVKKKEFWPIKGLFFLVYGANVSLLPFLTLQARSLGITEEEVGIIYSFIPIAALIAPPLSGIVADRIGNFKILLSVVTAMAGLTALLFLAVPPARVIYNLPEDLPVQMICSPDKRRLILFPKSYQCDFISEDIAPESFEGHCDDSCYSKIEYELLLSAINGESNKGCKTSSTCLIELQPEYHTILHSNLTVEPTTQFDNRISHWEPVAINFENDFQFHNDTPGYNKILLQSSICPDMNVLNQTHEEICVKECRGTVSRNRTCSNEFYTEWLNPSLTFYSHLVIRLLKEFMLATSMPLLEGAAVTVLNEHEGDFGFQRMYCNIGMMGMTPIAGTLIDVASRVAGIQDYRPAMYMYCCLKLTAAFIILFLNMEFKMASTRVFTDLSSLMRNPEILCFLMATFLAGICFGYIETFLFWLLEDLGANKQLMGLTLTVGSVFGIPILMCSTYILKKLGHVNTIVLGFLVYIIRLVGYTIIPNPWWAMPFEGLECITVSLMVVTFVSYAAVLATPATVVTLQGMYGGLYNGVGRGAGSLIGGYLIERIGIFRTFQVIAVISGSSGLLYLAINLCFFRKNKNQEKEDNIEIGEIENKENN